MPGMSADQIIALAREAAVEGLNLSAERVRAVAVPLTPLEYGDLRSSLTVDPATEADLESAVTSDLEYAVYVHEDLAARHDDGQAKFLEEAARQSAGEVEQIMGAALARRLG